jgi:hypothetical protein
MVSESLGISMFTDMVMDGVAVRMGEAGLNSSLFADECRETKKRGEGCSAALGEIR